MCVCVCVCMCVFVTLCVCLSVITFVATWQVRSILSTRTQTGNTCLDDLFPNPDNTDHLDHITFWPITCTSKVKNGFTPNFTCM